MGKWVGGQENKMSLQWATILINYVSGCYLAPAQRKAKLSFVLYRYLHVMHPICHEL